MELLRDMDLFVKVVNAKGFRGAAEATGVSNSTLSRRIAQLEKDVGLRLLHRTTRKVELTEAGRIYYERCRRIVDEARIAHEQLGEMLAQPSGLLRASLPVDFAANFLSPLLPELARLYPGITFEFDLTPRRVDLVSESFDVAIRMGPLPDSGLIARQLARFAQGLYASPGYVEASDTPGHPAELQQHECITFPHVGSWVLEREQDRVEVQVGGRFRINSVGMLRQMARLDQGVILVAERIVAEDVAARRLIRLLPEWRGPAVPVYAVTETRLLPAKTLRFIEFLQEQLAPPPAG